MIVGALIVGPIHAVQQAAKPPAQAILRPDRHAPVSIETVVDHRLCSRAWVVDLARQAGPLRTCAGRPLELNAIRARPFLPDSGSGLTIPYPGELQGLGSHTDPATGSPLVHEGRRRRTRTTIPPATRSRPSTFHRQGALSRSAPFPVALLASAVDRGLGTWTGSVGG